MARNVLVVEDDADQLDRLSILLEFGGYSVRSADSVRMGLEKLKESLPELLILDYHLPDIKGSALLEKMALEPRFRGVPVLILTSQADPNLAKDLLNKGATAFMTKTESNSVIMEAIERLALPPKPLNPAPAEPS